MTTRTLAAVFLGGIAAFGATAQPARPNIVLYLADDLGWTGAACFGSDYYETPNIDRLAEQGMRFDRGYAPMANCAPSRASIMSGQYTSRHRVFTVGNYQDKWKKQKGDLKRFKLLQPRNASGLKNETLTIAESLKKADYATAMFGKWHLGRGDQHPGKRGFDDAIESHGKHFGFTTDPESEHPSDQYLSDFLCDRALAFMERCHGSGKPFFLYLPDFLVHAPLETKKLYIESFKTKAPGKHQKSPVAAGMIKSLDDSVGRVMTKLDELYWYLPFYSSFNRPSVVVRRGDWKLIHLFESGDVELYNTAEDIGETRDRAAARPELAKELNQLALKWLDDTKAPRMTPNSEYQPDLRGRR